MSEARKRRRRRRARRAMVSALAGGGLTAAGLGAGLAGPAEGQLPVGQPTVTVPLPPLPVPSLPVVGGNGGGGSSGPTGPAGPVVVTPQGQNPGGGPTVSGQGSQQSNTSTTTHRTSTAHQPAATPKAKAKPNKPNKPNKPTATHAAGHATAPNPAGPNMVALPPQLVANQFGVLPPSLSTAVSAAALQFYHVPLYLLPIYQAAAIQYGVPWQVLAAINEVETDYGRDLSVSSAGALGWMQFLPATWLMYGVDASNAGFADPYNPADAIFAAARYLNAAGARKSLAGAIFAYNHSAAYVDSVLLRAKLIASYPEHVIASLTGLTEGQVPIAGGSVVANSVPAAPVPTPAPAPAVAPSTATARAKPVRLPAAAAPNVHPAPRFALLQGPPNAPVRAVADGRVVRIAHSSTLGRYLVLRDVYDDVFTYADLGSVASGYDAPAPPKHVTRVAAPEQEPANAPVMPASAGVQPPVTLQVKTPPPAVTPTLPAPVKVRLYAHPAPAVRAAAHAAAASAATHGPRWQVLKQGSVVAAGTVLGRVTTTLGAPHGQLRFAVQPSGDTRTVDPSPILKNWQLLQNTLHPVGAKGDAGLIGATAGYVFLLTKAELQRTVLSDPGISIYACGRQDIASGLIDKRVLGVLAYLSRSGLKPTVTGLRCGHNPRTTAGTASAHGAGDGVDISAINGIAIARHQGQNSITDATIRTLLALQGQFIPYQIISLMTYPGTANTVAEPDAFDHLDIVFHPEAPAANARAAAHAKAPSPTAIADASLTPDQWDQLVSTVSTLPAPNIATTPSTAAVRDPQAAPANRTLGTLPLPSAPGG